MLFTHADKSPVGHESAFVAPNAVLCGDVTVGAGSRILYGAQLVAEGGSIKVGSECIVMENAVLRSSTRHHLKIGNNCLVGPNAHVVGCTIEDQVFIATGATVFHAAHLETRSEIRVNGVVHVRTRIKAGDTVPIGWVAVGDPASYFAPERHDDIWRVLKPLNFPLTVYGFDRPEADMVKITKRLSETLASHTDDAAAGR